MNPKLKVGFARVSTDKRAQDVSIQEQEKQLKAAGCDRVLVLRESAFKGRRRGWHELRQMVADGIVREVVCIDQSRLARDGKDVEFIEECAVMGVTVRALLGGEIETKTVGGFITTGVVSIMNQATSRMLSLKSKAGLDRLKAQGKYACGRVPFGYAYDKESGQVIPHPVNFDLAREMFLGLLEMEMNVYGYARHSQCGWSSTGLKQWVVKPMLRGVVPGSKDGVKPIILPEEWLRAKRFLKLREGTRYARGENNNVLLFTGLVKCQGCGKNLKYHWDRRTKAYPEGERRLRCANFRCAHYCKGIKERYVKAQVTEALLEAVDQMKRDAGKDTPGVHPHAAEISRKQIQLESLEQMAETVDGLTLSIETLRREIDELSLAGTAGAPDLAGMARSLEAALREGLRVNAFSDENFRALTMEYVAEILYIGDSRKVSIRVRDGLSSR